MVIFQNFKLLTQYAQKDVQKKERVSVQIFFTWYFCAMCTRVSRVFTRFTEKHKEAYTQEKIFDYIEKYFLKYATDRWYGATLIFKGGLHKKATYAES